MISRTGTVRSSSAGRGGTTYATPVTLTGCTSAVPPPCSPRELCGVAGKAISTL